MASFNVKTVTPAFNATGVYLDATVQVTFNENVLASSVTDLTFSLIEADTNIAIAGTVEVIANKVIRFTPDIDLTGNTRYQAIVLGGGSWGVLSAASEALSDTVSWIFDTGLYLDTADAVDLLPGGVDPEEEASGDELYLVSSTPEVSAVNILSDRVIMIFTDILPDNTDVTIDSTHPLGYPAGSGNYWADHYKLAIDGTTLTVQSSGDLSGSLVGTVEFINNENAITEDSILISESGAVVGVLFPVTFGIDPNFQYTIRVNIPTNTFTPQIEFVSKLLPQLITVDELRLFSGPVLSQFNDFTLTTLLYKTSLTAKAIWTSHGFSWPATVPYYAKEYVLARAQKDMLAIVLHDAGSAGGTNKALGDLRLGSRMDPKSLTDELRSLELLVSILGQKLSTGNISLKPILGPAWAEAGKEGGIAVVGSLAEDAAGRNAPRYRSNWGRKIEEQTKDTLG